MHHLFHSRQILTSDIYNLSLHDALPISQRVEIETSFITLGQFIKLANVFESGGMIKAFLQDTGVLVNGEIEQRRGRKLYPGDVVEIEEIGTYIVATEIHH